MRRAIPDFTRFHENIPKVALWQLSSFHCFLLRFCRTCFGCGQEHLERSVGHDRLKILVRRDQFDELTVAQVYLGNTGVKQGNKKLMGSTWTMSERMTDNRKLLPHTGCLGCYILQLTNDDKIAHLASGSICYQVSEHILGQEVDVCKGFSNQPNAFYAKEPTGTCQRSYVTGWAIAPDHYLHTLVHKPYTLSGSVVLEAAGNSLTFEHYPHDLLNLEYEVSAENSKKSQVLQTDFYQLTGNMATSKNYPALGQRIKVDSEGFLILFIMVLRMLTRISKICSERSVSNREQCVEKNDPTICDEFGDISCDKEGSERLYNRRSLRAGRKSMSIKNTLSFDLWFEIFKNPFLMTAIRDSLIRKASMINMNGQWSCIKETCK